MIIDKILKIAEEDHNKSLQERVFAIVPSIGLGTLFLMIFIGMLVGDDIINTVIITACFILFSLIVFLSIRLKKVKEGATIIGVVLVILLLPIAFVFGGGVQGGSPLWFVFGFAYIGMTVEGRRKYVLMGVGFITMALSYYISYNYPWLVPEHTKLAGYFDSFSSVILVSVLLTLMILLENMVYMSEAKLIAKQKEEIEELSQARNLFFSNVSHEIRTPLDSIVGFNEIILRETDSEAVMESAENIKSASKILLNLINDVLDVSKLEAGKMDINPVDYDFLDMFSEVVNMAWSEANEKGLRLNVDMDPEIPRKLVGDDIRIQQILINLLNNSVKYTETGEITISVRATGKYDNHIDLVFSVEDTGIGIKKDEVQTIFDEFTRINAKETKGIEGSGLGLLIVKQLTEQMHGEIQVNSIYTKGTTFVVTIPQEVNEHISVGELSIDELRKHREKSDYIPGFEAPGARILIVDDDQMNRSVTAKLFQDTKIGIDQAASGSECLEKCAENEYDCIFMDQVMPEMDGTETLRRIREQIGGMCRETPVVVITAYSSADDQARFRMAGFDGYLLKPVGGELLENTLLRLLPAELIHRIGKKTTSFIKSEHLGKHRDKLPVLVTTESIADLPKEIVDKLRIPVIPFMIKNKNGSFIDGVEADSEGVLEYMAEGGDDDLTTDCPTVEEYEDFFASHLSDADNIIHISLAGGAGPAFHVATEAAASFDKVHVIDSESVSSGIGLLVMEAVQMVQEGMSVQECIDRLERIKKNIHTSFLIKDVDYLIKFGKVNPNMKGISRIFLLHPAVIFRDGKGGLDKMFMGAVDKVRKKYVKMQLDTSRHIDRRRIFIVHTGLTNMEIDDILRWIGDRVQFDEVIVQKQSAAMAAVHGVGAVGLLFKYGEE